MKSVVPWFPESMSANLAVCHKQWPQTCEWCHTISVSGWSIALPWLLERTLKAQAKFSPSCVEGDAGICYKWDVLHPPPFDRCCFSFPSENCNCSSTERHWLCSWIGKNLDVVLTHILHLGQQCIWPRFSSCTLLRLHFDGFGQWLVFSREALCDAFTTEVVSSKELCYSKMIGTSCVKKRKQELNFFHLLCEKCRCISKAVVIKILRFLFFSKGSSDYNFSKRLRA